MRDLTRDAEKRLSRLSLEAAEQFDSPIVHNRVAETIDQDDRLRQFLDTVERVYDVHDDRVFPNEVEMAALGAANTLDEHVERLVEDLVAEECARILCDKRQGWFEETDVYSEDDIVVQHAVEVASEWLEEHDEAFERNRLGEMLADPEEVAADV